MLLRHTILAGYGWGKGGNSKLSKKQKRNTTQTCCTDIGINILGHEINDDRLEPPDVRLCDCLTGPPVIVETFLPPLFSLRRQVLYCRRRVEYCFYLHFKPFLRTFPVPRFGEDTPSARTNNSAQRMHCIFLP